MPIDVSRTVTFVPCAYILLKLLWTLFLIQVSFEMSSKGAFKLTLRPDSRVTECLLVLTAMHEGLLDGVVFTKTESNTPVTQRAFCPGILTRDLVLVVYMLYFYREAARLCQEQSAYDFSALVVWVLCSILLFVYEIVKAVSPHKVQGAMACSASWVVVALVSVSMSVLFSDACLLSSLKMVSYTNLCLRSFAYTALVVSRCYLQTNSKDGHRTGIASNIMIFSHLFVLKNTTAALVFFVFLACHGLLLLNFAQTEGKPVEEVEDSGRSAKTPPPLNPDLLAKLHEMEAGMALNGNRKRTGSMFAPGGTFGTRGHGLL